MTTVSHVAAWALDDVSVDVQADQPVVQLSTSSQQARSGGMLTVVIQLTQAVSGLDQSDVVVRNGTAAGLTRFKTKILGVGDLFTLLVRPAGGLGDAFNVSVHVPAGACHNHNKKPNLPSNTLVIPYKVRAGGGAYGVVTIGATPHQSISAATHNQLLWKLDSKKSLRRASGYVYVTSCSQVYISYICLCYVHVDIGRQ